MKCNNCKEEMNRLEYCDEFDEEWNRQEYSCDAFFKENKIGEFMYCPKCGNVQVNLIKGE